MVSIILCTYNRAPLLPAAIRSVLHQTYPDWELVIIDDGSSDDTRTIVRSFQRKDTRIVYHSQTNRGLARARNAGLRLAQGDLLTFIDSDDEWLPSHLERRVRFMEKHPGVDLIHGGVRLIGPRSKHSVVDLTDRTKRIHLSKCHIGGTFFFRRRVLRSVRTFRPIPFGEDFDFFRRVERRHTIARVPFRTYLYHLDSADRLCDIFTERLLK